MKRMKKIIAFLILICSLFSFSGCILATELFFATIWSKEDPYQKSDPSDYPEYPDYQSAYTEEEHIARLTEITNSGAWKYLDDQLLYGVNDSINSFEVELVYAFCDNDPEFFLIDLTASKIDVSLTIMGKGEETNEGFIFGYIFKDEYYVLSLRRGKNPWEYAGFENEKKYFGSYYYAIESDGVMTVVFEQRDKSLTWIGNIVSYGLSEMAQIDYMQYNYLYGDYYKYEMKEPSTE